MNLREQGKTIIEGYYSRLHVKLPTRFCRILLRHFVVNTTTRTNIRNSVSILLQILLPGESTMGVPLAAPPPLRVVEAML